MFPSITRPRGGTKSHVVVPVRLYLDPVQVYLVAWDEAYSHLICLATTKMSNVRPVARPRMSSTQFADYGNYARKASGQDGPPRQATHLSARFEAAAPLVPYLKRCKLHGLQTIEDLPDGRAVIELPIHNPVEFVRFILRFGRGIKVLGDEEVLSEMRDYLSAMMAHYS